MREAPPHTQMESAAFRYEKKFVIEGMRAADVITVLKTHPAMFSELYPMRYVNNIYLDSPLLSDYYSNVNGYHMRQKVRVRWYHDLLREVSDGVLEFKMKEGEVGTKEQFPFPEFHMEASLSERRFHTIIRNSNLPTEVKYCIRYLEFAILNRYQRWYFATPDKRFRITVDADLIFYHLGKLSNQYRHHATAQNKIILELKYAVDDDRGAHKICSTLPFRVTRNSKYISGIDSVYV